MRPRPDAAENPAVARSPVSACSSFNEAAARCRGKPWKKSRFSTA